MTLYFCTHSIDVLVCFKDTKTNERKMCHKEEYRIKVSNFFIDWVVFYYYFMEFNCVYGNGVVIPDLCSPSVAVALLRFIELPQKS